MFIKTLFWIVVASFLIQAQGLKAAPNFLVIIGDDCTYSDLPVHGGSNAKTPNLDRLAADGLTFDRAYLTSAMCQPCRAELYTGQFPMRNGCAWNHSASRPGTRSLPHFLRPLGYRVGLSGKVHVMPDDSYPFEKVAGFEGNCTKNPTQAHDLAGIREFMGRQADSPFCLVVALVDPHVPWVMGDASKYPPAQLKLPSHLADTPKTRQAYAAYLAEITYMDDQIGQILGALDGAGKTENTLVLFTSEQGAQFPGAKWTCWDVGLHTSLIARWPGQVAAGKRTDAIVHYADLAPTLLEVAGGDAKEESFDGMSFAAVLRGEKASHRSFAYGAHNNVPEGPPYPVRTVTDGEWRYIRNLSPNELYIERHLMGQVGGATVHSPYWPSWLETTADNEANHRLVKRYMSRPAEELYHTAVDRSELNNLINISEHAAIQAKLSKELDRWLTDQGDPGDPQDTRKAHRAARAGEHLYSPPD